MSAVDSIATPIGNCSRIFSLYFKSYIRFFTINTTPRMTKIGLLSDTHSYLDDAILQHIEGCDEIWHAGDFGNMAVADALAAVRPLRGVYGNIDGQDIRGRYPEHLRFQCEEVDVWMTHIGGYPGRYSPHVKEEILRHPPTLFICGHSHILKVMYDQKPPVLHLTP